MTMQAEIIGDSKYIPLLNHGFIGLVDSMGNDESIVRAARVSYGTGTKKISEDRGLIRYLMKHKHTTPFEMVEFCFHLKLPIFIARQHIRHRMASVNEYSGRYSVMSNEFYVPEPDRLQGQSLTNKQGSGDTLDEYASSMALNTINRTNEESYASYKSLIDENVGIGLSRELSRIVLPVSNYTEMYWKIDLKNLLNYIFLRADSHAQHEIQLYANAMADFVKQSCPITYEAYEDYIKNGKELSRMDIDLLQRLMNMTNVFKYSMNDAWSSMKQGWKDNNQTVSAGSGMSKRELIEFCSLWKLDLE